MDPARFASLEKSIRRLTTWSIVLTLIADVIRFVAAWDEGGNMSAGFATMTVVCLRDPVSG